MQYQFQSTLPLRGATKIFHCRFHCHFISIHAPLTGSDYQKLQRPKRPTNFNPRSPYGERQVFPGQKVINKEFQSTLPLRGATDEMGAYDRWEIFQSTLPLRGATVFCSVAVDFRRFQSTLPLRGATPHRAIKAGTVNISIHAPLTGSDSI